MPKPIKKVTDSANNTIEELRALLAEAENALGSAGDKADGKVEALRERLRNTLDEIRPKLEEWRDMAKEQVKRGDEYVHEHPYTAAGIAAGVAGVIGLLAGVVISRRS
ncbi:MAG: DUF883 family protein [Puniceicoccales bacterium]|jgi:ElaB protein|nr:DUF883 family protein [Puniceicoccales bacterium]